MADVSPGQEPEQMNSGPGEDLENRTQPERPDVFASYSRKDETFVRRLVEALSARGKDVWVDWEDIRKTADWRAKIEAGIDSAKAVVAVLTPDFAASKVCDAEIEHAVRQNKRLVPILWRDLDGATLRDELNAPNWIVFRGPESFDSAVDELVDALETDLEWIDTHARLLVRAGEWERGGREKGFLLGGSDLQTAERWLVTQGSHREQPTPQQVEYVLASRHAAKRRQRTTLGAVLVALVAVSGLAVAAWSQRNGAIAQRKVAQSRAKVALSRELATEADSKLAVDPELSLLLATRAVETAWTSQAVISLRQALERSQVRAVLRPGHATTAAFSRDGKRVITVGGNAVRSTDVATKKSVILRWWLGLAENLTAISPGGRLAVTSDAADSWATLRDIGTGTTHRLRVDACCPQALAFSFHGDRVAVASGDDVTVWSTTTRKRVAVLTHPGARGSKAYPHDVAFDKGGARVITAEDGAVYVWQLATGKLLMTVQAARRRLTTAAFNPDGKTFATSGEDGIVRIWRLSTRRQTAVLRGHLGPVQSLSFSPNGKLLVSVSDDGSARVWEPTHERTVAVLRGHQKTVWSATFDRTGRFVVTTGEDETTRVWEPASDPLIASLGRSVVGVGFTHDGRHVLTASLSGAIRRWDPTTMRDTRLVGPSRPGATAAAFSDDGRFVAITGDGEVPRVLELARRRTISLQHGLNGLFADGAFSADDTRVLATDPLRDDAQIWEPDAGRQIALLEPVSPRFRDVILYAALSPDGKTAVTASASATSIRDVASGRRITNVPRATGLLVPKVDFSPDGRLVLETYPEGRTEVWNPASHERVAVFDEPGAPYDAYAKANAAMSPDGKFVVVARADDTAEVWDVATERVISVLNRRGVHSGGDDRASIAIAPDDQRIVVVGLDRVARLYGCDVCGPVPTLLRLARRRVTRRLTAVEREKYLHEPAHLGGERAASSTGAS
jgi:WD40 repeat protein